MSRPTGARLQSLCGTKRRLAQHKTAAERRGVQRPPCRYPAIWACQSSRDCAQRMDSQRR